MNLEKINTFISLARKGRRIEIGKTAVEILLKRKRAHLVIIAADASDKLTSEIKNESLRRNVSVYIFSTKNDLGKLCGRDEVATLAISDQNLATEIKRQLL